jgi:hypothetical protein
MLVDRNGEGGEDPNDQDNNHDLHESEPLVGNRAK